MSTVLPTGTKSRHKLLSQIQFVKAIQAEIDAQPKGPVLIAGDFDADTQDLPTLQSFLQDLHFVDVGAVADTFGRKSNEPTCLAANSDAPTRRDFVVVSADLFPAIIKFQVIPDDEIPVHSTLIV